MRIISKNYKEFTVDIGFNRFDSLKEYFGIDDDTGELKGCQYNYSTGIATFSTKLLPFIYDYFENNEIDTDCLNEIAIYMNNTHMPIDCSKQDFLYDEQYKFMKKICKRSYGIVQAVTGFGKNVLITYMVKHFNGKGNILIIAPTLSILDEIQQRAKMFNVEFDNNKVKAIHAAGFINSNYKNNDEWLDWMSKVELIIVDESENVSSSMETIFKDYCRNYKSILGLSATADRFNNIKLSYSNLKNRFNMLHTETSKLLYYFGGCVVYKAPDKMINVIHTYLPLPAEENLPTWMKNQAVPKAINNVLNSNAFRKYFDYIEKYYSDKVLFVPIKEIKQGDSLLQYCNSKNIKAVLWCGSKIETTDNLVDYEIDSYERIKKEANNHNIQVIIASKVGFKGIDIKAITDILLVIGSNASVVNQIIGRAYRAEEDIRLWMLYNDNDKYVDWRKHPEELSTPIHNACNGARMKQIRASQVYKIREIDLKYPPNQQPEKLNKPIEELELEREATTSKLGDKETRLQNSILDNIKITRK